MGSRRQLARDRVDTTVARWTTNMLCARLVSAFAVTGTVNDFAIDAAAFCAGHGNGE
jgi:hypothetical protein